MAGFKNVCWCIFLSAGQLCSGQKKEKGEAFGQILWPMKATEAIHIHRTPPLERCPIGCTTLVSLFWQQGTVALLTFHVQGLCLPPDGTLQKNQCAISVNLSGILVQHTTRWQSKNAPVSVFVKVSRTCHCRSDGTITKANISHWHGVVCCQVFDLCL